MATRTFDVERLSPADNSAVIAALARAFYDDPLFGYFLPDLVVQSKGLLSYMRAALADAAPFGDVWVARTDGKVAATAAWLPPGTYPRSARRELMTNLRGAPAFVRTGRRLAGAFRLLAALDGVHHEVKEPHYYLSLLGTDPLYQRSGAGSAAIQPVLDECDAQGLTAYLETQKEANLAYYARHAFELVRKMEVTGVPPVWTMIRRPKTS